MLNVCQKKQAQHFFWYSTNHLFWFLKKWSILKYVLYNRALWFNKGGHRNISIVGMSTYEIRSPFSTSDRIHIRSSVLQSQPLTTYELSHTCYNLGLKTKKVEHQFQFRTEYIYPCISYNVWLNTYESWISRNVWLNTYTLREALWVPRSDWIHTFLESVALSERELWISHKWWLNTYDPWISRNVWLNTWAHSQIDRWHSRQWKCQLKGLKACKRVQRFWLVFKFKCITVVQISYTISPVSVKAGLMYSWYFVLNLTSSNR